MTDRTPFRIVEEVYGYWHYHLAKFGEHKSLCGQPVRSTQWPLKHWGQKNPPLWPIAKWCNRCAFGESVK